MAGGCGGGVQVAGGEDGPVGTGGGVLVVAEKPSVAKAIAAALSGGRSQCPTCLPLSPSMVHTPEGERGWACTRSERQQLIGGRLRTTGSRAGPEVRDSYGWFTANLLIALSLSIETPTKVSGSAD